MAFYLDEHLIANEVDEDYLPGWQQRLYEELAAKRHKHIFEVGGPDLRLLCRRYGITVQEFQQAIVNLARLRKVRFRDNAYHIVIFILPPPEEGGVTSQGTGGPAGPGNGVAPAASNDKPKFTYVLEKSHVGGAT